MNFDLQNYVNVARQQGKSNEVITQELLGAGWNNNDINEVLGTGGKTSRSKYFVILFALFVVLIVGGYVFYTKQKVLTPADSQNDNYQNLADKDPDQLSIAKKREILSVVPIVRKLEPGEFKNSTQYSFKKINFKVPFSDLVKETPGETSLKLIFGDGKVVAFMENKAEFNDLVNEFLGTDPKVSDKIKEIAGPENFASTYAFLKFVFNLTPDIAEHTTDVEKQALEVAILIVKSSFVVVLEDTKPVIYNFDSKNVRGFQHTALDHPNKLVDVFDNSNNGYAILTKNVTQSEMDYILSTISTK